MSALPRALVGHPDFIGTVRHADQQKQWVKIPAILTPANRRHNIDEMDVDLILQ